MTLRIYIKKSSVNQVSHSGFEVYIFIHIQEFLRTFLLTSLIWLQLHSMYSHFYPFFFLYIHHNASASVFFYSSCEISCLYHSQYTTSFFFSKFSSVNLV